MFRPVCQCVIYISRNRCLSNGINIYQSCLYFSVVMVYVRRQRWNRCVRLKTWLKTWRSQMVKTTILEQKLVVIPKFFCSRTSILNRLDVGLSTVTRQSNPPNSQLNSPCNESTSVWSMVYTMYVHD